MRFLKGDFAGADPDRGRFRDLLKTTIRNMVRKHWSRQRRRQTASLDTAQLECEAHDAEDRSWLAAWRSTVLDLAWRTLEQEERSRSEIGDYTVLRTRVDFPEDDSAQLATRLAAKTGRPIRADALRQRLRRARLHFADLLLAEIGRGLADPTPERIEDELDSLGLLAFVRDLLPEHGES